MTYWYGQKDIKQKIKPKVIPLNVDLIGLRNKFSSEGYYKSCRNIINKINSHFGWEMDVLPIRKYEEHYDEIIKYFLDNYTIRDNVMLGSRTAHIIYVMKLVGYKGSFETKQKSLYHIDIPTKVNVKTYDDWEDCRKKIEAELKVIGNPSGYMALLCFYHGYPLRMGDIAMTNVNPKAGFHHLDLEKKVWKIHADKTKNRRARQFEVCDEFVEKVKAHVHPSGWLICRQKTGQQYKANVSFHMLDIRGFSVNGLRNSYETWNYARDVPEEEKEKISVDVLGHTARTARAYYTPHVQKLSEELRESPQQ
mgnify:CR=1 FL=1